MSCPLEGVQTLICISDEIVAAAHAARRASRDERDDSRPQRAGAISSDDLLPLLIAALVQVCPSSASAQPKLQHTARLLLTVCLDFHQAAPMHLKTCFEYIRWFHPSGDWNGRTGFEVCPPVRINAQSRLSWGT